MGRVDQAGPPSTFNDIRSRWSKWRERRALLAGMIRQYSVAGSKLTPSRAHAPKSPSIELLCRAIRAAMYSGLSTLDLDGKILPEFHTSVRALRNSYLPINKLPVEILGSIFVMSSIHCTYYPNLEAPSAVCAHWRQVAISTPALWTHIDISLGDSRILWHERAKVLLERSGGLDIHVHVDWKSWVNPLPDEMRNDFENFLAVHVAPHTDRVVSIRMFANFGCPSFVSQILECWFRNIPSSSIKSLNLSGLSFYSMVDDFSYTDNSVLSSRLDAALLSVSALKMGHGFFKWDSPIYHGLTYLELDSYCGYVSFSISQFVHVLSSSPKLVTLKLTEVRLTPTPDLDPPTIVRLDCLRLLNLYKLDSDSLSLLLPLIFLSTNTNMLTVGITADLESSALWGLDSFLQRSAITWFYVEGCRSAVRRQPNNTVYTIQRLQPLMKWLPNLQSLAICYYNISEWPTPQDQLLCVQEIFLMLCQVEIEALIALVVDCNVRVLRLASCWVWRRLNPADPCRYNDITMSDLKAALAERCPKLQCSISSQDVFNDWFCSDWSSNV